jgi:hypothetical protein
MRTLKLFQKNFKHLKLTLKYDPVAHDLYFTGSKTPADLVGVSDDVDLSRRFESPDDQRDLDECIINGIRIKLRSISSPQIYTEFFDSDGLLILYIGGDMENPNKFEEDCHFENKNEIDTLDRMFLMTLKLNKKISIL